MRKCDGRATLSPSVEWVRAVGRLAVIVSLASQTIHGQTGSAVDKGSWTAARTPDGYPDLQGVWNYGTAMPLQRPAELGAKASLTPEEAAKYEEQLAARSRERQSGEPNRYNADVWDERVAKADWTKRTSLITDPPDGKMPPITPQAEARRAERAAAFANATGPEDLSLADRCIVGYSSGPPIIPSVYSNIVQLFQSRDYVVIYTELIHRARIVPLDGRPPLRSGIRPYSGDSRGRWEKDTLVIETTNFTRHGVANLSFRQSGGTDENMHLIERLTRTGPDTLLYEFTITDRTTWTRPWSASTIMVKTDELVYEYACHEGNYGLRNILENARAAEKTVARGAVPATAYDNVHIRVADITKANEWYVKNLGARTTSVPRRVFLGSTLIVFVQGDATHPPAKTMIDHIGLSYPDLGAKMKELQAAGVKVLEPLRDNTGLFKTALIEDPWGVKLQLVQNPDALGFHHVQLRVPAPELALNWYESMIGGERGKLKGQIDGLRYGNVWLLVSSSGGESLAPSTDGAIRNLAWRVADVDQGTAILRSKGVKTVIEPTTTKVDGKDVRLAMFEDPNGVRVEVLKRPPE
jgi:catechol 2,3-dioxygenase-like lactoylglutathione lyase family enzyme